MNLLIIAILSVLLYIFISFKHLKQRYVAILIVTFLLFFYVSYSRVTEDKDVDYTSIAGLEKGARLYFTWLSQVFNNFRSITGNVIRMDWSNNETSSSGG